MHSLQNVKLWKILSLCRTVCVGGSVPWESWLFSKELQHMQQQNYFSFIFCWPCILLWFMVNDQLDAQFFSMYLFQFCTCFTQPRAHHQENQLYQYNLWYMSLCVGDRFVCRSERNFLSDLHTKRSPTQSDKCQRLYWYNWFSWWWARGCPKHVGNWNKYIEKNCASSWSFTMKQNYCVTVIQKVHMSQRLVHGLFWVPFLGFSLVFGAYTLKQTMALLLHHFSVATDNHVPWGQLSL